MSQMKSLFSKIYISFQWKYIEKGSIIARHCPKGKLHSELIFFAFWNIAEFPKFISTEEQVQSN